MDHTTKDDLAARLRRIEGQVRGIARMIEEDKYCIDVLTQVSAVGAALDKVGLKLIGSHMRTCVRDAMTTSEGAGEERIQELVGSLERFLKA